VPIVTDGLPPREGPVPFGETRPGGAGGAGATFRPVGVRSLGYVRLSTPDVDAWRRFAGDFLGMAPTEGADPGSAYYRIDEFPARLVVSPGEAPATTAIGFEVMDRAELAALADAVRAEGIEVTDGTPEECEERRVSGMVRFCDPGGNAVELFHGPFLDHRPLHTPEVSAFVTGDMGMGHVIVSAEDGDAARDFYTRVLGFVERNTMAKGRVVFMGCNPRHHTLGITTQRGPGRLLHLMLEVATLDDVGRALDRAHRMDVPMMHTLGRHTNDRMVSFYVYSPEGYAIEVGCDGLRVEVERPSYEITAGAYWGHRFTPPPQR
jgi:3,4-dihydroxy-9,10-secoandrosta-1,3,5(10)-triene-9,17-dione 4,5-dioxygenase